MSGERTREINDLFTSLTGASYEHAIIADDQEHIDLTNETIKPDIYAMLAQMQGQITDMSLKQQTDSHILQDLRSDVAKLSLTFRTFHGTLNSILSRMPENNPTSHITKLQNDVTQLSSTIGVMNKRFLDKPLEQITDKEPNRDKSKDDTARVRRSYSATVELTKTNDDKIIQDAIAAKISRMAQNNSSNDKANGSNRSDERVQIANEAEKTRHNQHKSIFAASHTSRDPDTSVQNQDKQVGHETTIAETHTGKFIAARRRKITSYFIGNIDASVSESDVREYLKESDIRPTHMTMFYGKNGSSARLNIYFEDEAKVESGDFWPEGVTCRKWVSKSEWENERQQQRDTYRSKYSRYRRNNRDYDRDKYDDTNYRNNDRDNNYNKYDYSDYSVYRNSDGTLGGYHENERTRYNRASADIDW